MIRNGGEKIHLNSILNIKYNKMLAIDYENFKCEDCGGDKFTMIDDFNCKNDITLNCANKDCEASYTFTPEMKLGMSSHPPKICPCNQGFLSRTDNYCSGCGKKNPYSQRWRTPNIKKPKTNKSITKEKGSASIIRRDKRNGK